MSQVEEGIGSSTLATIADLQKYKGGPVTKLNFTDFSEDQYFLPYYSQDFTLLANSAGVKATSNIVDTSGQARNYGAFCGVMFMPSLFPSIDSALRKIQVEVELDLLTLGTPDASWGSSDFAIAGVGIIDPNRVRVFGLGRIGFVNNYVQFIFVKQTAGGLDDFSIGSGALEVAGNKNGSNWKIRFTQYQRTVSSNVFANDNVEVNMDGAGYNPVTHASQGTQPENWSLLFNGEKLAFGLFYNRCSKLIEMRVKAFTINIGNLYRI